MEIAIDCASCRLGQKKTQEREQFTTLHNTISENSTKHLTHVSFIEDILMNFLSEK